jgi:hypothetical protein
VFTGYLVGSNLGAFDNSLLRRFWISLHDVNGGGDKDTFFFPGFEWQNGTVDEVKKVVCMLNGGEVPCPNHIGMNNFLPGVNHQCPRSCNF